MALPDRTTIKSSNRYQEMKKIEYINQRLTANHFSESDYTIIGSLIYSLTPDEACSFFDLSFGQDYRVRQYVLRKISSDISKSYTTTHRKLITTLLKKLSEKKFNRKESCAFSIDFILDSLPAKIRHKILKFFLTSKSSRNRDRAYKRLNAKWDKKYFELIKRAWYLYHDRYCLEIILNHFPTRFLLDNYKDILKHTQPFQTSKLFIKSVPVKEELLDELKKIDGISYCYVLVKLNKMISAVEAKRILKDNYKDDRIGLLLWSFGQMGLWDVIIEYDNKYRKNKGRRKIYAIPNN